MLHPHQKPLILLLICSQFSSVQLFSCVWLFATPWIAARQACLSVTNMLYHWTVPAFACSPLDLGAILGYHLIHRSTNGSTWPWEPWMPVSSGSSASLPVFRLWNLGTALHMFSAWFYPLGHHSNYTFYKTLETAWNAGCQSNHWKDQAGLLCSIFMLPGDYSNEYSFFFLFSMIFIF